MGLHLLRCLALTFSLNRRISKIDPGIGSYAFCCKFHFFPMLCYWSMCPCATDEMLQKSILAITSGRQLFPYMWLTRVLLVAINYDNNRRQLKVRLTADTWLSHFPSSFSLPWWTTSPRALQTGSVTLRVLPQKGKLLLGGWGAAIRGEHCWNWDSNLLCTFKRVFGCLQILPILIFLCQRKQVMRTKHLLSSRNDCSETLNFAKSCRSKSQQ